MRNTRNALALLRSSRGHQGTGCRKQDLLHGSGLQSRQKVPAQHAGTAPAARAAGVSVLRFPVVQHCTAVPMHRRNIIALLHHQIAEQLAADQPQIAGDNGVIRVRCCVGALEVPDKGICCRRSHCCSHVVGICHAQIYHGANTAAGDTHAVWYAVGLL